MLRCSSTKILCFYYSLVVNFHSPSFFFFSFLLYVFFLSFFMEAQARTKLLNEVYFVQWKVKPYRLFLNQTVFMQSNCCAQACVLCSLSVWFRQTHTLTAQSPECCELYHVYIQVRYKKNKKKCVCLFFLLVFCLCSRFCEFVKGFYDSFFVCLFLDGLSCEFDSVFDFRGRVCVCVCMCTQTKLKDHNKPVNICCFPTKRL